MQINPNSGPTGVTGVSKPATTKKARLGEDKVAMTGTDKLDAALQATPAVRTDKLDQAKNQVADASYPPEEVIKGISVLLTSKLSGPDSPQ
jgi:hypothetical protein